jgi:hypothetical protein
MKSLHLLAVACMALLFTKCTEDDHLSGETGSLTPRSANDVAVCHINEEGEFQLIYINQNAAQAHLNHGDYLPDADLDGYSAIGACTGTGDDCDDTDATIYPGATEVPDDGIDQDCNGEDETSLYCPCFSAQDLEALRDYAWSWGWWSDVPGCKDAPFENLMELWITNAGLPAQNFNFSAQAGTINGNYFASSAKFNHLTGQFDLLCGGYTTQEIAEPCIQILNNFIEDLKVTHPDWDYCVRVP